MTILARSRRPLASAAGAVGMLALIGLGLPSPGSGALRATAVTISGRAAFDRVVVRFDGELTGLEHQVDTPDPAVADGRAVVRINGTGIHSAAKPLTRRGVEVRVRRRPGSILVLLGSARGRYKFVQYRLSGDRRHLVIQLWRSTVARAATVLDDGCLRMTGWRGGARPRARGLELTPLFEHGLALSLRGAGQSTTAIAERPLIASEGTFRADFSGYSRPGRWGGPLSTPAGSSGRAMLEAWSASAKDGSLECLVQVPVRLG